MIIGLCLFSFYRFIPDVAIAKVVAEPEPIDIDLQITAVIVIDMQNAFIRRGGMFDL